MKIKYLLLATISGAIVGLDQLTKMFIHTHFHLGETHMVIPNVFDVTYVRNFGAAFGVFSQAGQHFREPFFIAVPVIALIAIIFIMRGTKETQRLQICALSLIFGGAIGNYVDRLRFKFVIDFLDFHWKEIYHWPAFNIADSAIVVGVCILVLQILFHKNSKTAESAS